MELKLRDAAEPPEDLIQTDLTVMDSRGGATDERGGVRRTEAQGVGGGGGTNPEVR